MIDLIVSKMHHWSSGTTFWPQAILMTYSDNFSNCVRITWTCVHCPVAEVVPSAAKWVFIHVTRTAPCSPNVWMDVVRRLRSMLVQPLVIVGLSWFPGALPFSIDWQILDRSSLREALGEAFFDEQLWHCLYRTVRLLRSKFNTTSYKTV